MAYADITTRDPNPIKRWLQNRRYADALRPLGVVLPSDRLRILDFGAGNGELVRRMPRVAPIEAWVYEPTPSLMAQAKENLEGFNAVRFVQDLDSVESGLFDYVFCLEVFEHLPRKETIDALAEIHRLLKSDGLAVIGVPHELFLPAMLKGFFRMARRYGAFDARPSNILAAFLGRPQSDRPISEMAPGVRYHFHHLGFDYRALCQQFQGQFRLLDRFFSPFPIFGAALNSEVYFLLRKAPVDPSNGPRSQR